MTKVEVVGSAESAVVEITADSADLLSAIKKAFSSGIPGVVLDTEKRKRPYRVNVNTLRLGPGKVAGYRLTVDGQRKAFVSTLPALLRFMEAEITPLLLESMVGYQPFHAGALAWEGKGILLPGASGAGKSTLTAALSVSGFTYFSDEVGLVDESGLLWPFPKAIALKRGGWSRIRDVFPQAEALLVVDGEEAEVSYLLPGYSPDQGSGGGGCPIHLVLLPRYLPGAEATLRVASRSEAFIELHSQPLHRVNDGAALVGLIGKIVGRAQCYRLEYGDDLKQAVELVRGVAG